MHRLAIVLALVIGCARSNTVICDDGTVCPASTTCDAIHGGCVSDDQRAACKDLVDGERCEVGALTGECRDKICFPDRCGDGLVTGPEQCEATDLVGEDCTAHGFYDSAGLACSKSCEYDTSACTSFCGDHTVNGPELCDGKAPRASCHELGYDLGSLGCSAGCGPDLTTCRRAGWESMLTTTVFDLNAVWPLSASDVYAVGLKGTILHYDGVRWTEMTNASNAGLYGVWGTATRLFAVGKAGTILQYQSGVWTTMTSNTTVDLRAVYGTSDSDVWAVGLGATVVHWDGNTWTVTTGPAGTTDDLRGVWARTATDVFAVGKNGTIVHYNGSSWAKQPSTTNDNLNTVWGTATRVYAAGGGDILRYDGSWATMNPGNTGEIMALWGTSDRNIFAVSDVNGRTSHYDGARWRRLDGTAGALFGLTGTAADDIIAVGSNGAVFHSTGTWMLSSITNATGTMINGVWAASSNDAFAVGSGGAIFRFNGVTWAPMTSGVTTALQAVWGTSSSDVYAVGAAAASRLVLHFDGNNWSTVTTAPAGNALDGVFGVGGTVFFVGNDGQVMQYNGAWSATTLSTPVDLNAVWGANATDVWAVGENGTIAHYTGTWTVLPSLGGFTFDAIVGTAANNIWAVGENGIAYHYDGATWAVLPKFSPMSLHGAAIGPGGQLVVVSHSGLVLLRQGTEWFPLSTHESATFRAATATTEGVFFVGDGAAAYELVQTTVDCGAAEATCANYLDDDCDGLRDACDPDCAGVGPKEHCANDYDDDCDGMIDCLDADCAATPTCTP